MSKIKIAFFDAKDYDRQSFIESNNDEYEITYLDTRLTEDTCKLAEGYDVVCIFVNDDAGYIKEYHKDGLYSHNPKYPPIRFNENDTVRCVGRVLGKIKPDQFSIE